MFISKHSRPYKEKKKHMFISKDLQTSQFRIQIHLKLTYTNTNTNEMAYICIKKIIKKKNTSLDMQKTLSPKN
jgi:hypothetical protein